jgi:SEC-C motif
MKTTCAFQVTSKRRKGFPSETGVKRGDRIVRGVKELAEKLGRNDPCPCGSARSFQALLLAQWLLLTARIGITTGADHVPNPANGMRRSREASDTSL